MAKKKGIVAKLRIWENAGEEFRQEFQRWDVIYEKVDLSKKEDASFVQAGQDCLEANGITSRYFLPRWSKDKKSMIMFKEVRDGMIYVIIEKE